MKSSYSLALLTLANQASSQVETEHEDILSQSRVLKEAHEHHWDYSVNGANWPSLKYIPNNNCGGGTLRN